MTDRPEIDQASGVETTGHEWDGIKELDNPLPRWWLVIFWATILVSVVYWIFMPSWPAPPGGKGYLHGLSGNSERLNVARDLAALKEARSGFATQLAGATLDEIEADPELLQFALASGEFGLRQQLRHMPRLGRGGRARLSQSQRRRLAVGRHACRHRADDPAWHPQRRCQ